MLVSKKVDFYPLMNIADRLILYASIDDKKQLLCWLHGLIRPLFVCRAVDPSLVLHGGCAWSGVTDFGFQGLLRWAGHKILLGDSHPS